MSRRYSLDDQLHMDDQVQQVSADFSLDDVLEHPAPADPR
jgi:hypothetical protein